MSDKVQRTQQVYGADSDSLQIVTFMIGEEEYGFDIADVQEIIRMRNIRITAIPNAPGFVEGVVNLRGRMIPVADLRERFGLDTIERGRSHRIVFTMVDGRVVGVVVDAVVEVVRIKESEIEELPELATGVGSEHIQGVCRVDDRVIILLKTARLFTDDEATALAAAGE